MLRTSTERPETVEVGRAKVMGLLKRVISGDQEKEK
jgi:hypothetical protein